MPILYDKRLPPQQQLCLLTSRLPMTFHCPTWLGHSLSRLHAVQHGVVHLKWVRDPSARHARQFHTGSDPLLREGEGFLKSSCVGGELWRHRGTNKGPRTEGRGGGGALGFHRAFMKCPATIRSGRKTCNKVLCPIT